MALPLLTKQQIYDNAGSVARELDRMFVRVQQYKAWLDTQTDSSLISSYGAVQPDLDILRSALADLEQLRTIYQGSVNLAVAKDFRAFSKQTFAFGSI
jgi:hypothetical protein